jgi:hypothetical protein
VINKGGFYMKRWVSLFLSGVLAAILCSPCFAVTKGNLDGGNTYVPVRGAFEELNFQINWDGSARKAYLKNDKYSISIPMDKDYISVNGQEVKLNPPQKTINGSLYLPLRALGEVIGAEIGWNGELKLATIGYDKYNALVECDSTSFIGDVSCYADYKNVPDLGKVLNINATVKKDGNTTRYLYSADDIYKLTKYNPDFVEWYKNKLTMYGVLLSLYGFTEQGEGNSTNNSEQTLKNPNLKQSFTLTTDLQNLIVKITQE